MKDDKFVETVERKIFQLIKHRQMLVVGWVQLRSEFGVVAFVAKPESRLATSSCLYVFTRGDQELRKIYEQPSGEMTVLSLTQREVLVDTAAGKKSFTY